MSSKFMHVNIALGDGRVIKADLEKDLAIDTSSPEVIANQLEKSAALMYYWGSAAEYATRVYAKVKQQYEQWMAEVHNELKEELVEKFGKSNTTETTVKNEIIARYGERHKEWIKALSKANYDKNQLNWAKDCFAKRNDNMVNLLSYYKKLVENGG